VSQFSSWLATTCACTCGSALKFHSKASKQVICALRSYFVLSLLPYCLLLLTTPHIDSRSAFIRQVGAAAIWQVRCAGGCDLPGPLHTSAALHLDDYKINETLSVLAQTVQGSGGRAADRAADTLCFRALQTEGPR
jgi:hypothetical protein